MVAELLLEDGSWAAFLCERPHFKLLDAIFAKKIVTSNNLFPHLNLHIGGEQELQMFTDIVDHTYVGKTR